MFKREIIVTLVMSLVAFVVATIVAFLDPLSINSLWTTGSTVAVAAIIGAFAALFIVICSDEVDEQVGITGIVVAVVYLPGSLICWAVSSWFINEPFEPLAWVAQISLCLGLIFNCLTTCLARPTRSLAEVKQIRQAA